METVSQCLIAIGFYGLLWRQLCRWAKKEPATKAGRCFVIITGLGFVLGIAWNACQDPLSWTLVLHVVGAALAYTALLFSIPEKGKGGKQKDE